jgi:glutamate synthase (NADPH) small chain
MKHRVWAGGDIVTGAATVILAAGAGRVASNSIHDFLTMGW